MATIDEASVQGKVAWGDESMRQNATPQLYLMCATVFEDDANESLERMRRAKPRGMRKLHWRDLREREKIVVVEAMADVPHWSTVVAASPLNGIRQERGRRKALEVLLQSLESDGVNLLNLESRWRQEDKADLDMVFALQNRKLIKNIRVRHVASGTDDPRLWMPDQVLGAVGDILCGTGNPSAWSRAWEAVDKRVKILLAPL